MTSQFRSVTCLVIVDKYEKFHTKSLGMLTINVHAKFRIPAHNDLFLIVAKPKAQKGPQMGAMLVHYSLKVIIVMEAAYFSKISYHNKF
jgi:hypothetical protein